MRITKSTSRGFARGPRSILRERARVNSQLFTLILWSFEASKLPDTRARSTETNLLYPWYTPPWKNRPAQKSRARPAHYAPPGFHLQGLKVTRLHLNRGDASPLARTVRRQGFTALESVAFEVWLWRSIFARDLVEVYIFQFKELQIYIFQFKEL